MQQPQLWDYTNEDRAAWTKCVRQGVYDVKIAEREGSDGMLDRRLNGFVVAAAILGINRDIALLKLHGRAAQVITSDDEDEEWDSRR